MAEAKNETNIDLNDVGQRGKITLKALGDPGRIKLMSVEEKAKAKGKYFVGTIYGRAEDFIERTDDKKNEKFEGLRGTFVAVPADPERDKIESGVLFIPDAFHNILAGQLRKEQENDPKAVIEFALEFYSIEAQNPAGYSWHVESAIARKGPHVLANVMSEALRVQSTKHKALAAPGKR